MPMICYTDKKFNPRHMGIIRQANEIIGIYQDQGYELTLRQLYYQFVSRDLIPNNQREYKNLGSIINDGRMAGLIDWDAIVDRTRNVKENQHWQSPQEIVKACAASFQIDKWATQKMRFEVWIEKDALVGVIEDTCRKLDIPFFSCRGYNSQSEMWAAAMRYKKSLSAKQGTLILHLGDHDPSGIDMSRDIRERILNFLKAHFSGDMTKVFHVIRLALNRNQVDELDLPPNPAKLTDSRAKSYLAEHGDESWELDALEPDAINKLVTDNVLQARDDKAWKAALALEKKHRVSLEKVAKDLP